MRKLLLSALLLWGTVNGFAQQGDGGTPRGFKYGPDLRNVDSYLHPTPDLEALHAEDEANEKTGGTFWRFGYHHTTDYTLNNSGTWTELPDGGRIWQLRVICRGAVSVNLIFKDTKIPEGCELYIYNEAHDFVLGKFTEYHLTDGQLGTELVPGSTAILEYYVPASQVNEPGSLNLFKVSHGYRSAIDYEKGLNTSGSCNMNVNCPDGAPWADQKRGAVMLVSNNAGGSGFCSGSLINNTANDGKPYVLTANHCSQGANFATWFFRFNWEAAGCSNPGTSPAYQSLGGSVLRARRTPSDFCLVEITGGLIGGTVPAAYNPYFNGWNNANTPPTSSFSIHHPDGDIKKISFDDDPSTAATAMGSENNGTWRQQWDRNTTTEGGSSGSPLFDQNGRIIGQLWGGGASCSAQTSPDYYGRLYNSWEPAGSNNTNQLKYWLDPSNSGATTLDGYDPNAVSLAVDAQLAAVASPASGTTCNTNFTPQVTIRNKGTNALTAVSVKYRIDNGTETNYAWTGNLASNATVALTLPAFTATPGNHVFKAYTSTPNGVADQNNSNDTVSVSFQVLNPTGQALPFSEGFESATFPPTGWTLENAAGQTWVRTTAAAAQGTASARKDNLNDSQTGSLDNLITPYLNLSGGGSPTLTFKVAYARYNANYFDSLIVWASGDCGVTWNRVYGKGNSTLATAPDNTAQSGFVPTAAQWRLETVNLAAYAGNDKVRLNFQCKNGYGQMLYIDDINIQGGNSAPVASFSVSNNTPCAGQTVNFTNSSVGATSYSWNIPGGTPSTSTAANPSVVFNTAGNYTVTLTATNANGSQTSQQTVTVGAVPATPVASSNSPVSGGNSIQLSTGTVAGATYAWTGPNGFTSTLQNPVANGLPANAGNYCVSVTVAGCSSQPGCTTVIVNALSSVEEHEPFTVSVFPNPANDRLYIQPGENSSGLRVRMTDMTGKTVLREMRFAEAQFSLDLSGIARGVYFLVLENEKGSVTRKIVKQ